MGVQRLPDPPLVPSSMSAGGEWHSNNLAMTAPGSAGVAPLPVGLEETLPLPVDTAPDRVSRNPVGPSGAFSAAKDSPVPQAGTFGAESYNAGLWKKTPSS